jgi:hypothetical protein
MIDTLAAQLIDRRWEAGVQALQQFERRDGLGARGCGAPMLDIHPEYG